MIPDFDDQPWEFTKTNQTGDTKDWHTPPKPKPPEDPIVADDPTKEDNERIDSSLIILAVVLMVGAAITANM